MGSIDDIPEHYREDFSGYEPDSPYSQKSQEMAYFKMPDNGSFHLKIYGEDNPPTDKDISHFKKLSQEVSLNGSKASAANKFTLAWHYEHGINSNLSNIHSGERRKDYIKAIELYEDIYKNSSNFSDTEEGYYVAIDACHQIGVLYEIGGYGIDKDYSLAAKWYLNGINLTHNSPRIKEIHYGKSISTYIGMRDSHITLARLFIEGLGVEKDHKRAIKLLSSYKTRDDNFPSLTEDVLKNKALKYYLFSKIYSTRSISNNGFFSTSYGGLGDYSQEDGYFLSENELKKLWRKWIKKAINHGYSEAIDEYAHGLDRSFELEFLNPSDKDEFLNAYEDTIESVCFYMKKNEIERSQFLLDDDERMMTLIPLIKSIHKFAIKAQKYDQLTKNNKDN